MEKLFYEEKTGNYYRTIKAAKDAASKAKVCPYIKRVWMENDKLLGECLVYGYGVNVCTIRDADLYINKQIISLN